MTRRRKQPATPDGTADVVGGRTIIGPTPEQMAHRPYERVRRVMSGIEVKTYVCTEPTRAASMLRSGALTERQHDAGEAWAQDNRTAFPPPSGKDSCVLRVGGISHETEAQAAKIVAARQRMNRLLGRVGANAYAVLRSVFGHDEWHGDDRRLAALRHALDAAAEVYGVPE